MEMRLRGDGTTIVTPLGRAKARATAANELPAYEDIRDPEERVMVQFEIKQVTTP